MGMIMAFCKHGVDTRFTNCLRCAEESNMLTGDPHLRCDHGVYLEQFCSRCKPVTDYSPGRGEVRITSSTGGQKGQKMIRLGGADPIAMLELGRIYGMGETKYDRFNYLKGYDWSLSIDALKRHLLAYEAGQDYDECSVHPGQHGDDHAYDPAVCDGSGLLHTAHVAWHGLTLTSFLVRGIGRDDRPPRM